MKYLLVKADKLGYEWRIFQREDVGKVRYMLKTRLKADPKFRPEAACDLFVMAVKAPGEVYDGFFVAWDDGVEDYIPQWNQLDAYLKAVLSAPFPRDTGSPTIYGLRRRGIQLLMSNAPWVDK